jgi:hypothetical protein
MNFGAQVTADRLNRMQPIKNIELSLYVPGALAQPQGERQSLNSFLDNPLVGSAAKIRMQISAGRERGASLSVDDVRNLIRDARRYRSIEHHRPRVRGGSERAGRLY